MKKKITLIFIITLFCVPVSICVANGETSSQVLGPARGSVEFIFDSSDTTVGQVKRWRDIGPQALANTAMGRYVSFNEPKSMYPMRVNFYKKEVKVKGRISAGCVKTMDKPFQIGIRVDGKITVNEENMSTIVQPLADINFSDSVHIKSKSEFHRDKHTGTVYIRELDSPLYTVTNAAIIHIYADAVGEVVPSGGGESWQLGYKGILGGLGKTRTTPAGELDLLFIVPRAFDEVIIRKEDVIPTGYACECPDTPPFGFGSAAICAAKPNYNTVWIPLPSGDYHKFLCNLYNPASGLTRNHPAAYCQDSTPVLLLPGHLRFIPATRWVCYNSNCGPFKVARAHALKLWYGSE